MSWQRGARLAIAAVGLACAAAIYYVARPRPGLPPPLTPIVVDEQALEQGGHGINIRLRADGTRSGSVEYQRFATYPDGRSLFFDATLRTEDEPRIEARADVIEVKGRPGQNTEQGRAELQGHVRLLTGDGLEVRAERARYEDETERVTIQGPLSYTQGRITGEGIDGTYDRREKILSIADGARATVAPGADGETETQASSKSMTLVRPLKELRLDTGAQIVRRAERLSGDRATLHMTADEQHVQRVALRGQAQVTPTGAADAASPPEMRADTIDLHLHEGGQTLRRAVLVSESGAASMVVTDASGQTSVSAPSLNAELAPDGATLVRLEGAGRPGGPQRVVVNLPAAAGSPAREIQGDRLVAGGVAGQGLRNARFSGSVSYKEQASGSRVKPREATADTLTLVLDGRLSAVSRADFQGHARFSDGPTSASADQALYGAADKTLELRQRPGGGPRPQAETSRASVGAREIDLWLESQDLVARGDVVAGIRPGAEGTRQRAGVFDASRQVTGRAETLRYRGTRAVFEGAAGHLAAVTQDDSEVRAEVVALVTDTNNLEATGRVEAKFSLAQAASPAPRGGGTGAPAAPSSDPYTVTGHQLTYDDATRTLVMVRTDAAQAKLTTSQGIVEADRIVFTLEAETRALKTLLATGAVYAVLDEEDQAGRGRGTAPRQRRAVADTLEFTGATKRYVLSGQPSATIVLPAGEDGNCRRVDGTRLEFQLDREELAGDSSSLPVPCTIRIR
jgi:lipopolysaccharide export system protein LptA